MNSVVKTVSIFLISVSQVSSAAILPNTDTNEAKLGGGIRVETEQIFPTCLEPFDRNKMQAEDSNSTTRDPKGAKTLRVKSEVIRSFESLDEYTNESISAEVSYMAYSGSAHYNRESKFSLSSDTITVGIKAEANYGRWYIRKPTLKSEFAKLAAKNPTEFYKRCGREYVSGYKLGQGLNIILRTEKFSSSSYEKVDAGVSGSVSAGQGASGSVQAAFLSVTEKLMNYSSLNVQIIGFGVNGLRSTSKILRSKRDVEEILRTISEMVAAISENNAVVTDYMTSTYPIMDQKYSGALGEARRQTLKGFYSAFRQVDTDLSRIRNYVNHDFRVDYQSLCDLSAKDRGPAMSCDDYARYITDETINLNQARAKLIAAIQKCANGEGIDSCGLGDLEVQMRLAKRARLWPHQYRRTLEIAKYQRDIRDAIRGSNENN